jgi:hypothetical protein
VACPSWRRGGGQMAAPDPCRRPRPRSYRIDRSREARIVQLAKGEPAIALVTSASFSHAAPNSAVHHSEHMGRKSGPFSLSPIHGRHEGHRQVAQDKKAVLSAVLRFVPASGAGRSPPGASRPSSRPRWIASPISRRKDDHGYHRHFHPHRQRLRSCAEKCPLAPLFEALARRRPGQAFPQRSEDNA